MRFSNSRRKKVTEILYSKIFHCAQHTEKYFLLYLWGNSFFNFLQKNGKKMRVRKRK